MTRVEEQIRADIVEAGRRLYARAYIASNDGNISARLDDRRLITTPKSVSKGFMTPDMMVIVDYDGKKLVGRARPVDRAADAPRDLPQSARCRTRSSTRTRRSRPGFAVAGIPLTRAVLAEVITTLGSIPIAAYGTPSTSELPDAVRKYIKAHDGMLLANHGAVTCGPDVMSAYYKMETIEHFAKISLVARLLGRREPDLARRSRAAAGAARDVRHPVAGAALRRSIGGGPRPGGVPGARSARIQHRSPRA